MKSRKSIAALMLIFIFATANQTIAGNFPEFEQKKFYRTELYFGMDIPGGGEVTETDWEKFTAQEITPRFPEGFTVIHGYGQFKNSAGIIERENSRVVILFYPKKLRHAVNKKIEDLRAVYKRLFKQESVMRFDYMKPAEVSF